MKKYFIKAIAFSIIFIFVGFYVINYIDSASIDRIDKRLDNSFLDSESTRLLLMFSDAFKDNGNACRIIEKRLDSQMGKVQSILGAIEEAKKAVFLGDVDSLKKRYYLANAELFLLFRQAETECGQKNDRILFFYLDGEKCADCFVQGKILDDLRASCPGVKTFAFPFDSDNDLVSFLRDFFKVSSAPAVVVNSSMTFNYVAREDELRELVGCS